MQAVAEGEVRGGAAVRVDSGSMRDDLGVAVRAGQRHHHDLAGLHELTDDVVVPAAKPGNATCTGDR